MSRSGSSSKDADDFLKRSILSKIDKTELQALRIQVKRRDINTSSSSHAPLERNIDDPAKIVPLVHMRNDCRKIRFPPIFGKGIKVNQGNWDNRQVFSKERSKSRSRTPKYSRKRRSRTRSREKRSDRSRSNEKRREKGIFEPRSDDEEHKSTCPKYKERRRSTCRERPKSRSPTPLRPGEYRPGHPELALRYKKRSSRSPGHSSRRSSSPRRSGSPRKYSNDKKQPEKYSSRSSKRTPSPRRSRSPLKRSDRSSPSRYKSGERRGSPSKSDKYSRRSRTPPKYEKRRSRTPPYKSSSSREYRRSRTPTKKYYDRTRSPRDSRRRSRSPPPHKYTEGGPHPDYGYYEGGFWLPGPALRPGFPVPRYYPPPHAFYPRVPGPMMIPRVPMMHPFGPIPRQQLPVYNSGAVRPKTGLPQTATKETDTCQNTTVQETTKNESIQVTIEEVKEGETSKIDGENQEVTNDSKDKEESKS